MVTRCLPCAKLRKFLRICKWIFVGCGVGEFNTDFHGLDVWFSTDFHIFLVAVKFNTDFHGWDVWFSTDFHGFLAAVKFNTDFHGLDVWFSTDFHRFLAEVSLLLTDFADFDGKVFHGLSVRWNYLCYLCNLCEVLGVGYEKRTAVLAVLCVKVAGSRIELETSGLWIRRSNQLSYPAILACPFGFASAKLVLYFGFCKHYCVFF